MVGVVVLHHTTIMYTTSESCTTYHDVLAGEEEVGDLRFE